MKEIIKEYIKRYKEEFGYKPSPKTVQQHLLAAERANRTIDWVRNELKEIEDER